MAAALQAAVLASLARHPFNYVNDSLVGLAAGTQAGATPVTTGTNRCIKAGGAGGSFILPKIANNEAEADVVIMLNADPTNAVAVFAGSGDSINGSVNGSLSVAALGVGVFFPVRGIAVGDWRAGALT